jgi:murein L,D-transpeptidase YafK
MPAQVDVVSSARSRAAIERVKPQLEEALEAMDLSWGVPIFIRIFKEEMQLELWVQDDTCRLFNTYDIVTFGIGPGPKERRGDCKAPEGFYFVTPGRMNPLSAFHLSMNIGYPNAYDRAIGRTGGNIMIHGSTVSIGCFAMTDTVIERIYAMADAALRNGQRFFRVHIFPFRMDEANMERHSDSEWLDFWENLKEGYDWFEERHIPPNVETNDRSYIFTDI